MGVVITALLVSCGGSGGGSSPSVTQSSPPSTNVTSVVLDSGPAGTTGIVNVPYVTVTVCRPGTSVCQTIDHILLDTASTGLRIIVPGVFNGSLALPAVTDGSNNPVSECAVFASGFTYGSVHRADIKISGETALNVPIEEIGDTNAPFNTIPPDCSSSGADQGTVAAFGANGVLGVGLFAQDCGSACVNTVIPATYYGCTTSCSGIKLPLASQVTNPVTAFTTDNNGVALVLPTVPNTGMTTLAGSLIFGIGTQSNNGLGTSTIYAADSSGYFDTTYKGTLMASSFLDSGSNGLFFNDGTITLCTVSTGFYCPATPATLSATNASYLGGSPGTIHFTIVNLDALSGAVIAAPIGGQASGISGFDWGLPFFFGRTVFVALEGTSTPGGVGPFWAY